MYSIDHLLWPGGSCRTLARHLERRRRWETLKKSWRPLLSLQGCSRESWQGKTKALAKTHGSEALEALHFVKILKLCTIFYIIFVQFCTRVHCEVHCVCAGSFPPFSFLFHKEWRLQRLQRRQFDKGFLLPRALAQHVYTPMAAYSIQQHPTASYSQLCQSIKKCMSASGTHWTWNQQSESWVQKRLSNGALLICATICLFMNKNNEQPA